MGDDLLDWLNPAEVIPPLEATTTILRVLTVFSLYEDAVEDGKVPIPVEAKYPDFCVVMRDMLCQTWRLFYLLFRRALGVTMIQLPNEKSSEETNKKISRCCEMLSLVHEELGVHKWCGCGHGTPHIDVNNTRQTFGINDRSVFEIQQRRCRSRSNTMHVLPLWDFGFSMRYEIRD